MQTLDHEQFQSLKELAEIQGKIAEGRAVLADLEISKEKFLAEQAESLKQRIKTSLEESREHIADINKYHDELVKYRKDTDSFVKSIRYFNERVMEVSNELNADIISVISHIDEQSEAIKEAKKEITLIKNNLKAEKEEIEINKQIFKEEEKKLKDGRETLNRAINRLKQGRI